MRETEREREERREKRENRSSWLVSKPTPSSPAVSPQKEGEGARDIATTLAYNERKKEETNKETR